MLLVLRRLFEDQAAVEKIAERIQEEGIRLDSSAGEIFEEYENGSAKGVAVNLVNKGGVKMQLLASKVPGGSLNVELTGGSAEDLKRDIAVEVVRSQIPLLGLKRLVPGVQSLPAPTVLKEKGTQILYRGGYFSFQGNL